MNPDDRSAAELEKTPGSPSWLQELPGDYPLPPATPPSVARALSRALDVSRGQSGARNPDDFVRALAERRAAIRGSHRTAQRPWLPVSGSFIRQSIVIASAAIVAALAVVILRPRSSDEPNLPVRHYATSAGQQAHIRFGDGSAVLLAPSSALDIMTSGGTSSRTVRLRGEARFTVSASAPQSFVVLTSVASIRVLGTVFGVQSFDGDSTTRVSVEQGKVALSSRQASVTVAAGAVGYATDSTATAAPAERVAGYTGWKDGQLVFKDAPVPELLATIGRWYGYRFALQDSTLMRQYVTVTLDVANASEMMTSLRHLLGVTMTVRDSVVTLTPQSHRNAGAPRRSGDLLNSSTPHRGR
jgi:ferric-dicitrate binding protein FerR (iron transport regulator)